MYEDYFDRGTEPGEIPEDLLDLGSATSDQVAVCTMHALRLHRLLQARVDSDSASPRDMFKSLIPQGFALHLLLAVMLAAYKRWDERRKRLVPV